MHKSSRTILPSLSVTVALLLSETSMARTERIFPVFQKPVVSDCRLSLLDEIMVPAVDLQITFDGRVYWIGDKLDLPNHNLIRLLLALTDSMNEPLSIPELYEEVWVHSDPDNQAMDKSVSAAISALRSAFKAVDPTFDHIQSVRNAGYMWNDHRARPDIETPEMSFRLVDRTFYWKNELIHLSPGQARVIDLLLRKMGEAVSYDRLYQAYIDHAYDGKEKSEISHILRTELGIIKKLIRRVDSKFDRVQNVRGHGMIWVK